MKNRYQQSPLSLIEGGDRIKITFKNGLVKEYENIKDVEAYIGKVIGESEYTIDRIEVEHEKQVVVKVWKPLFFRIRGRGYGTSELQSYNPEI